MKKKLLIFIDGLQYDVAVEKFSILKNSYNGKLIPGVGFSNNLYPEMICGKNPDEIGFFNKWSPKKNLEDKKLPYYRRSLDLFRNFLYINAGIRKIILNKLFNLDYANIPFKYAHYFKPQGSHDFEDIDCGILKDYNFRIFDSVNSKKSVGNRDKEILNIVNKRIKNENSLISLIDLDNIAHIYGNNSLEFNNHISYLDSQLARIIKSFKNYNNSNEVYLFSDHGMADVSKVVNLDIEKHFGEMDQSRYLYFLDSTYLRVWVKSKDLYPRIKNYLQNLSYGEILNSEEREKFGITNPEFGDFIFRAKEGVIFIPNFYGARVMKAMHGYKSTLRSQLAIFSKITNENDSVGINLPSSSKDIYYFLKSKLQNS